MPYPLKLTVKLAVNALPTKAALNAAKATYNAYNAALKQSKGSTNPMAAPTQPPAAMQNSNETSIVAQQTQARTTSK
jgi:hypothetical protein